MCRSLLASAHFQEIQMKEKHIQISGIVLMTVYAVFIAWLYWAEPKSLAEVSTKAQTTIENVSTKTQVAIGTYEIDQAKFAEGLQAFRQDNFVVARNYFEKFPATSFRLPARSNSLKADI